MRDFFIIIALNLVLYLVDSWFIDVLSLHKG